MIVSAVPSIHFSYPSAEAVMPLSVNVNVTCFTSSADAGTAAAANILAQIAAEQGEVPVGAIVVKKSTGEIVGRGFNRREYGRSPLTHAEIVAIDEASKRLGGWRLIDCELFVTLEPCPMCAGAMINSRVERVVFGAYDAKAGSCELHVNSDATYTISGTNLW